VLRSLRGFFALFLFLSACGDAPPAGGEDGGDRPDAATDLDGGGDGGSSGDDGGSSGDDGGPGECSMSLEGSPCSGSDSCTFTEGCLEVRCECHAGAYSCEQQTTCATGCPEPAETDCESPCTGDFEGCLCRCGGPNYSSCACEGGEWSCSSCGG
jgi:hypothetical protein